MNATRIKTIVVMENQSEFDELVNKCSSELKSFAIQTHVSVIRSLDHADVLSYSASLFYKNEVQ